MNWLGEKPVSIVKAWNTLCEALWERMEHYRVDTKSWDRISILPEVPCKRKQISGIRSMIPEMQNAISCMLGISFDPASSGQWSQAESTPYPSRFDHPDFDHVDRYAFWLKPEYLPSYRHTVSEFISQAAKLVNDKIRYPLPLMGGNASVKSGFKVDCDMLVNRFSDGSQEKGRWLENHGLPTVPGKADLLLNYLAVWYRDLCNGGCSNHCWYYFPNFANCFTIYKQPQLTGTGKLRSRISAQDYTGTLFSNIQEFTIDFSTNRATENIDFSPAAQAVGDVLHGRWENMPQAFVTAKWEEEKALQLSVENFPKPNYKYME